MSNLLEAGLVNFVFLINLFRNTQSTEIGTAVYEMDWPMLPANLMKTLLLVITRSKRPIVITSGYIVTLSNDSFMKVRETISAILKSF